MRKIVVACVAIEFAAVIVVMVGAFGASLMVFWIAIAAATIGGVVAFIVA